TTECVSGGIHSRRERGGVRGCDAAPPCSTTKYNARMGIEGAEPIKFKKAKLPLVLAIDVGTSSTRALVYDAEGRPVRKLVCQVGYALTATSEGGAYADPKLIVESTFECIDRVMEEMGRKAEAIEGVGLDT